MFVCRSLPAGDTQIRLRDLIQQLDADRFLPEVFCLTTPGAIGDELAREFPVHAALRRHGFGLRLLLRLTGLFRRRRVDAVMVIGGDDVLCWGRLAAWGAAVPVVLVVRDPTESMDACGRLYRWLTRLTAGVVSVAWPGLPQRSVALFQNAIAEQYELAAALRRGCHTRPRRDTITVE